MTNDFADTSDDKRNTEYKKTEFMKMTDGNSYTVRILEPKSKKVFSHFLAKKYSVECPGDDCPMCKRNSEIYARDDKNYYKDPDYVSRQKRYYVNVLDKTEVKTCGKCGAEYTNLNKSVCDCGEVLPEPAPSNKVKVLSKGPTVFEDQLNVYHKSIVDEQKEIIGINNYDIQIVVSGRGKDTKTTVIPQPHRNSPVPEGLELYDLDTLTIKLEPEEMLDVNRGVSLKDVFAARKAEQEIEFGDDPVSDDVANEVQDQVNKLFS